MGGVAGDHILIVEDDADLRLLYERWLTREGFAVRHAHDGAAAWESILEDGPALVVTDHRMPDGTGLDVLKRIRTSRETAGIPVVFVTGFTNAFIERTVAETDNVRLLEKPVNREQLLAAVAELMERRRA
jgi:DNA-binding response OmpR family regulator